MVPWTAPIGPPATGDPPGLSGSLAGHPMAGVTMAGLAGGPQGDRCSRDRWCRPDPASSFSTLVAPGRFGPALASTAWWASR